MEANEKQTKKFRNLKASTKFDKNGGGGIADFIVNIILKIYLKPQVVEIKKMAGNKNISSIYDVNNFFSINFKRAYKDKNQKQPKYRTYR